MLLPFVQQPVQEAETGVPEHPVTGFENSKAPPAFHRKTRGGAFTALMSRENDTETAHEFDAENKTRAITDRTARRRSPLSEIEYTYDEVGNRTGSLESP